MSRSISIKKFTFKITSIKLLLLIIFPALLILGAAVAISVNYQIPISTFTKDTVSLGGIHPISGFLSNLGILLWCVAGTSCGFAALIQRHALSKEKFLFLIFSALLSGYLLFDDLFLFHEVLGGTIGLNENVTIILLGAAVLTYLITFRKVILFQTDVFVFILAMAFLSLSVLMDKIIKQFLISWIGDWQNFAEDAAKWIGIVFWCSYFVITSYQFSSKIADPAPLSNIE